MDYDKALVYIEQALEARNAESEEELLKYRIVIYEQSGDYVKAEEFLAEYLEKYPMDVSAEKELIFLQTR